MRRLYPRPLVFVALLALGGCGDDSSPSGDDPPATEFAHDCFITLSLTNEGVIAYLDLHVGYERASGDFVGSHYDVECARLDERLAVYANDYCEDNGSCVPDGRGMYVSALGHDNVPTPVDLLRCRFGSDEVPDSNDFDVLVLSGTDEHFAPVTPLPVAAITSIDCLSDATTTTTTTLPPPCADVSCPVGEACLEGVCVPSNTYEVDFAVENAVEFGALQFDTRYDCGAGEFDGDDDAVHCEINPDLNAYWGIHESPCDPATNAGQLTAAVVSVSGYRGPVVVMTCAYTSTSTEPPSPQTFTIEVIDASTPSVAPIPDARVSVQAIRPVAPVER